MTKKEITIAGQTVTMAYCFATEIGFKKMSGQGIEEFDAKNQEHVIYLILSAISAYYQSIGEEMPIKSETFMFDCKPNEIIEAMKVVFELRMEWYELPFGDDEKEEEKEGDTKND